MQTIHLDVSNKGVVPAIYAKQGDVGRKFRAVITDNGEAYDIPADALLSVWYSGTSGEGNYSMIGENSAFSIDGNTVTVELITQMLTNHGGGNVCLVMNRRDGTQIGTWNIPYIVEQLPGMGSSAAEQYFTALSEVAGKAAESAAKAAEAAATFETDTSLSVAGKAADAAATGGALAGAALKAYPVGAIYMSLVSTSPAELFGGTWERILQRFLFAAEDGAGYYGGTIGGEATHTLTANEMPNHRHTTNGVAFLNPSQDSANAYTAMRSTNLSDLTPSGGEHPTTSYVGGGQAHNNMPPYLAVYMWKRVA